MSKQKAAFGPIKNNPLPDEKIGGDDAELLRIARERYQKAIDYDYDNRVEALEDLEFLAGDMWPAEIKQEREEDRRPVLTIDRISQAIAQITGDIRQANPAIRVRPGDGAATIDNAKIYTGLIRSIEAHSDASAAYIGASETSVECGIGHFRIVTEYSTDDTFEQDIRVRRIPDPFAVTWDPHSIEQTRSDAQYCFVEESIDVETYKARWPKASLYDFESNQGSATNGVYNDWFQHRTVRVAEYWTKTPKKCRLALLTDGRTIDVTDFQEVDIEQLKQFPQVDLTGVQTAFVSDQGLLKAKKVRTVYRNNVEMRLISGAEVLEGPFEWAGQYIPIIPVIGEEIHVQNKCVRMGVVRRAKDPQRLYNIWRSAQTEKIALEPKVPWTVTAKNIAGYEFIWKQANARNMPYLPYTPDPDNGGIAPQRNAPQMGSQSMAQDIAMADADIKATTRIYDAGLGNRSNETSGKAIRARQSESDVGTYVYMDNLTRSMRYAGHVLVDLIPKIYDTERVVRILNDDDSHKMVPINQKQMLPDGSFIMVNDLSVGKYDVMTVTGPAYTTRRAEASEGMIQLAQAMPQTASIFVDLLVKNMDWPHADEIAKRLRKTLPPGIAEPVEGEPDPPPPQPTPEEIRAKTEAENLKREADRKDAATIADIEKTRAETEQVHLKNAEAAMLLALQDPNVQQIIRQQVTAVLQAENDSTARARSAAPPGPTQPSAVAQSHAGPGAAPSPPEGGPGASYGGEGWMDMGNGVRVRPA